MNLARFVMLKRGTWDEFEGLLDEFRERPDSLDHQELESLAFAYRKIVYDLSLCRARFPNSAATERLQALAIAGTRMLQAETPKHRPRFDELHARFSTEFRRQWLETGFAVILFLVAGIFGFVTATVQPELGVAVLGVEKVEGLRNGELWTESLTTTVPPSVSSSFIATNNMSVALMAWVGGAIVGLGPLNVCLVNGHLLGSIFAVTHHWSMAARLGEFVAAHGPLEISLILVACGAGLRIARALVVAGDGPRSVALRRAAGGSLVVVLGCLPWFAVLGLVESLISPSPLFDPLTKFILGQLLMAAFVALALSGTGETSP